MIGDHLKDFDGLAVVDWPLTGRDAERELPAGAAGDFAWRISAEEYLSDATWPEVFESFASAVDLGQVRALIVGVWNELLEEGVSAEVARTLAAAGDRLPALRALFFGDITYQEAEISWIRQCDVSPLLEAFPALEVLGVRGTQDLVFPALRHERLRSLTIESGGMPVEVARAVAACDFPALRSLELWLGTSHYGGDCEVADLAPFLTGARLPSLRRLALRNSEIQDEVAAACASAPVVARLEELDLSMGVLTDEGAAALLGGQPLTHLRELNLRHNYFSRAVLQQLRESLAPSGVRLDLGGNDAPEGSRRTVHRYVAVGE
jgi:hypothetical protein